MDVDNYSVMMIWGDHRGWVTGSVVTKEKAVSIAASVAENYSQFANFQLRNSLTVENPLIRVITVKMIDRSCNPPMFIARPYTELST